MSYPCPKTGEDCGYPACAHDAVCEDDPRNLLDKLKTYLRVLAPHMRDRAGPKLIAEAARYIENRMAKAKIRELQDSQ